MMASREENDRDDVRRIQRQHETDCRAMYSPRPPKLAPHPRAAMDQPMAILW
jgi:hypothetical protein